jgi:hypothetical protein
MLEFFLRQFVVPAALEPFCFGRPDCAAGEISGAKRVSGRHVSQKVEPAASWRVWLRSGGSAAGSGGSGLAVASLLLWWSSQGKSNAT